MKILILALTGAGFHKTHVLILALASDTEHTESLKHFKYLNLKVSKFSLGMQNTEAFIHLLTCYQF